MLCYVLYNRIYDILPNIYINGKHNYLNSKGREHKIISLAFLCIYMFCKIRKVNVDYRMAKEIIRYMWSKSSHKMRWDCDTIFSLNCEVAICKDFNSMIGQKANFSGRLIDYVLNRNWSDNSIKSSKGGHKRTITMLTEAVVGVDYLVIYKDILDEEGINFHFDYYDMNFVYYFCYHIRDVELGMGLEEDLLRTILKVSNSIVLEAAQQKFNDTYQLINDSKVDNENYFMNYFKYDDDDFRNVSLIDYNNWLDATETSSDDDKDEELMVIESIQNKDKIIRFTDYYVEFRKRYTDDWY